MSPNHGENKITGNNNVIVTMPANHGENNRII